MTRGEALKAITSLRAALAGLGPPGSGPGEALRALLDAQRDYVEDPAKWREPIINELAASLAESLARYIYKTKREELADADPEAPR